MLKKTTLSLVAVSLVASSAFGASSLEEAFKNGSVNGEIRLLNIVNTNDSTKASSASTGIGGKLHFETEALYGVKVGATAYTSNPIKPLTNETSPVTLMFDKDSQNKAKGFTVLGEAYIQADMGKTTLKIGRQQIDSPLAGSDDVRMIPNTFEAGLIINKDLPDTTLIAGYVRGMMGLDSVGGMTKYVSMSAAAGVDSINNIGGKPVYVLAAVNNSMKDLNVQVWNYYAVDVLNATYGDVVYAPKMGDVTLTLGAQYYNQKEIGKLKEASPANLVDYSVYGLKAGVASEKLGLTLTGAYNKVSENTATGATFTFGAWGGYSEWTGMNEMTTNTFGTSNMNNAKLMKVGVDFDMGALGLGKRILSVAQGYYDYDTKYTTGNKDQDTTTTDVVFTCDGMLLKNLKAQFVYETINAKDDSLDQKYLKAQFTYSF